MKRLLTIILTLSALAAFTGLAVAQRAGEMKTIDKASPKLITGKVMSVDPKAKTFTILSKGKEITFNASKLKTLPKTGEVIDVTYTDTGGPMEATNLNSSRSNIY